MVHKSRCRRSESLCLDDWNSIMKQHNLLDPTQRERISWLDSESERVRGEEREPLGNGRY